MTNCELFEMVFVAIHCQPDEFKCRDGTCINKTLVCNKRRDCADASDEDNCGMLIAMHIFSMNILNKCKDYTHLK